MSHLRFPIASLHGTSKLAPVRLLATECKSDNDDGIIQGVFCPDDVPS